MSSIKAVPGRIARVLVRALAVRPSTRWLLNRYHAGLNAEGRERYHRRFTEVFELGSPLVAGDWTVDFLGRTLRLPLRPEHGGVDWASALAIVGHDIEVKTTYERLLASAERPEVFLDVGANYGTHSILFASQGVRTISFEPNPECREYQRIACEWNGLSIQWEPVAIGDHDGEVELVYPQGKTWLGSIAQDVGSNLASLHGTLSAARVPLRRLDNYAGAVAGRRVLLKVDVEGAEAQVLAGASALLEGVAPTIIFESNDPATRPAIAALLAVHRYVVVGLPLSGTGADKPLSDQAFRSSRATNFLARREP